MKVYVCSDHVGFWPVPTASVVVAKNHRQAHSLLATALKKWGLPDEAFTLQEISLSEPGATILSDGEY